MLILFKCAPIIYIFEFKYFQYIKCNEILSLYLRSKLFSVYTKSDSHLAELIYFLAERIECNASDSGYVCGCSPLREQTPLFSLV